MPDSCQDRPTYTANDIRDAVSIHTHQIEDACIDRDCLENLRVYLTRDSQAALDTATGVQARSAELLFVSVNVDRAAYHRGHYSVDMVFFYRIICDTTVNGSRPSAVCGLATFAKRVVLSGGTSCAKVFSSSAQPQFVSGGFAVPEAVVEAVDPVFLSAKVQEVCACCQAEPALAEVPARVSDQFGEPLVMTGGQKRLYVTLGQFSAVRLERETQLTVPVLDFTVPNKDRCDEPCCEESPCEAFSRIDFPVEAFFPCYGQSVLPTACKKS